MATSGYTFSNFPLHSETFGNLMVVFLTVFRPGWRSELELIQRAANKIRNYLVDCNGTSLCLTSNPLTARAILLAQ